MGHQDRGHDQFARIGAGLKYVDRLSCKHNKGKALEIYTHKLGRAVYFMLKNKRAFDMKHFFSH